MNCVCVILCALFPVCMYICVCTCVHIFVCVLMCIIVHASVQCTLCACIYICVYLSRGKQVIYCLLLTQVQVTIFQDMIAILKSALPKLI